MDGVVEVLVPVLIAGYTAVSGWYECTGVKDPRPIAENMCGDLRQALNESCASVVSLPIPQASTSIGFRRSLILPQLSDIAKDAAKDSYKACGRFWGGETNLETYKTELAKSASLLSMALKRSSTEKASRDADQLARLVKQQGVSSQVLQSTMTEIEENVGRCGSTSKCAELPQDVGISLGDLQSVKNSLEEKMGKVQDDLVKSSHSVSERLSALDEKMKKLTEDRVVQPHPPVTRTLKFLTDIYFDRGRSDIAKNLCNDISTLVADGMVNKAQSIVIYGYADVSGLASINEVLSRRRAENVAACLKTSTSLAERSVNTQGNGSVKTLQIAPASMRRASIYLSE